MGSDFGVADESAADAFDTALDVYRDEYRRIVLALLLGDRDRVSVDRLTRAVVTRTLDRSPAECSAETIERVRTSLSHQHLPRLADAGIVSVDRDRGVVERDAGYDRLQPFVSELIAVDPTLTAPTTE